MPDIIDTWDVGTFDQDLRRYLESNACVIRSYFDTSNQIFVSYDLSYGADRPMLRPENPYAAEFYALIESIGKYIAECTIRAFHYTRLTDEEVADLRTFGVHCSTPKTLRRRLDSLVRFGHLAHDDADRLYARSPFHGDQFKSRSDKFWMTSHPLPSNDGGVVPLIKHWGGEVASMWIGDSSLSEKLTVIGKSRIIEIAAPLVATRHGHAASKSVVATFGRSLGAAPEKSSFDLYVKEPLPASAVIAVHTEGDTAFSGMGRTYPAGFIDVDVGRWKELTGEDD